MDTRAIITGTLAAIAITSGTILAALNKEIAGVCFALASTCAGYAVGLYSEPVTNASNANTNATSEAGSDEA